VKERKREREKERKREREKERKREREKVILGGAKSSFIGDIPCSYHPRKSY
jgi:hypothetical protein